ncbi:MAG: hypothetical protein ABJP70_06315 [Erythrobacter sp.]
MNPQETRSCASHVTANAERNAEKIVTVFAISLVLTIGQLGLTYVLPVLQA